MLLIRKPWGSQPQGSDAGVLNPELPPPLVGWSASGVAGTTFQDLATGGAGTFATNAASLTPTPAGLGLLCPPGVVDSVAHTLPSRDIDLTPIMGHVAIYIESLGTGTSPLRVTFYIGSTSIVRLDISASGLDVRFATSGYSFGTLPLLVPGLNSFTLCASDTEQKVYCNGALIHRSTVAAAWAASTTATIQQLAGSGIETISYVTQFATWTGVYDKYAQELSQDPWLLFAPRSIWVPVSAGGGGTTHTISPTGGITFGGTGTEIQGKVIDTSGGVSFTGTGNITFNSGGTTYTIVPSGGITFGGTGTEINSKIFIPAGGFTFGGTATIVDGKVFPSSGGISFSGTGNMTSNTTPVSTQTGERTKVGAGA